MSPSEYGQPNPSGKARAVIPVERIRGPILRAHRFDHPVTALRYPDAGHLVGGLTAYFGSLTDNALTSDGGTVPATQAAQADALPSCSPCSHPCSRARHG